LNFTLCLHYFSEKERIIMHARKSCVFPLACFAFLAFGTFGAAQSATKYRVIDLGARSKIGSGVQAYGINSDGDVTGVAGSQAFIYSHGKLTGLGMLPGFAFSGGDGINVHGQATGTAQSASYTTSHAFIYSHGAMMDLGAFSGGSSYASAINDLGQVTGYSVLADGSHHAFLWTNGVMHDINTIDGRNSYGNGINNSGWVVGTASVYGSVHQYAFVYRDGVMHDLGLLNGGQVSWGYAINSAGAVAGSADVFLGHFHAFLYINDVMKDLLTLGGTDSWAYGINSLGQVVGTSYTAFGTQQNAFLYSNDKMVNLNSLIDPALGISLDVAQAINDRGEIVVNGRNSSRFDDAFLLIPIGNTSTAAENDHN
jgi:probable HAF family extracellular repeat protein